MTKSHEHEWLKRIDLAIKQYNEEHVQYNSHKLELMRFVQWLYKEYGYEYKDGQPNTRN